MNKKSISVAVAVAAFTFIVLFAGSKFYEVYALQNPLSEQLSQYNINKMQYNQQEQKVILYVINDSDIVSGVEDVKKKFGNVEIELKSNASEGLEKFYSQEELYIMQFIDAKEYGTLGDYLKGQSAQAGYKSQISIDDNYIYLKLLDGNSSLFKIYPRWEGGV